MNSKKIILFIGLIMPLSFVVKADDLDKFYQCEIYQAIAIKKLSTGHDVIAATLNGVNAKFVIDTGAKMSVINERLLSKYSIDRKSMLSKEKAAGAAGEVVAELYPLNSLYFKENKIQIPTIASTELSQVINGLGYSTGVWVDGIIGQDVLLAHAGIIDSSNKQLLIKTTFKNQKNCQGSLEQILVKKGYQKISLKLLSMNLATLNLSINNKQGEFILDSGAGDGIININSMTKFDLSKDTIIGTRQSSGAGGAFTLQILKIDSFKIDSKPYDIESINALDLSAVVKDVKEHSQADVHGVVGQDLLQKYHAIISFYDNTLYLRMTD
jgi:predicted aspartyl protease